MISTYANLLIGGEVSSIADIRALLTLAEEYGLADDFPATGHVVVEATGTPSPHVDADTVHALMSLTPAPEVGGDE